MAELIVDSYDLTNLGFTLEDAPNAFDGVARVHRSAPLPGRNGDVPLARAGQGQKATFDVDGWLKGDDHADLRGKLDELRWRLKGGRPINLSLPDEQTRYWVARLEHPAGLNIRPSMTQTKLRVRFRMVLLDPYAYSTTETSVDFLAGATALPLGTGPTLPTITLGGGGGGFEDVALRAEDHEGNLIALMELEGAIGAGETLVVDCADGVITLDGANAASYLVAGPFLALDPNQHADFPASSWPTLEATNVGSGSIGSAVAAYDRSWE